MTGLHSSFTRVNRRIPVSVDRVFDEADEIATTRENNLDISTLSCLSIDAVCLLIVALRG